MKVQAGLVETPMRYLLLSIDLPSVIRRAAHEGFTLNLALT